MNKRIDFTNLGGLPMTQFTLSEMQDSYRAAFAAMANICGDKAILFGAEVIGANVTDGWISYLGELIPFVGGAFNAKVSINVVALPRTFENNNIHNVYFTKTSTCAVVGDFNFSDLTRITSLQNIWITGDLKQKYCNAAYVAANFDLNGFGLNREIGWQILSSQVPAAAGKVLVNLDATDTDFNIIGNVVGSKTHEITMDELPAKNILNKDANDGLQAGGFGVMRKSNVGDSSTPNTTDANGSGLEPDILNIYPFPNLGYGTPINIIQPSFVVLTLIKL